MFIRENILINLQIFINLWKSAQYVYLILYKSDKPETPWGSIIDIHPKKVAFLFDFFVIVGLQNFINRNDET